MRTRVKSLFEEHRPEGLYQFAYCARGVGDVFAFEQVTPEFIRFCIPASSMTESALVWKGITVPEISLSHPYPDDPGRYGRLSALKAVPELREEALFPIKVSNVAQALAVLDALS